ncbi:MAG: GntR family transcriptional regulator [Thermoguttaceae bacterium]|nr:GntR family transcriptional regulator [Thermoguttaceae bacterium]
MFQIDFNSSIPIYEQIERQARFLIASGAMPEGAPTPSVREIAKLLTINPQTVVKAYANLKLEGLLSPRRGQGFVVAEGAREKCRRARREMFKTRIEDALAEAARGRLSKTEISEIVDEALQKVFAEFY